MKFLYFVLAIFLFNPAAFAASKGKVLIVVSSENALPLNNGRSYETGYYFNELTVPARAMAEAGYELVFANPKGNAPMMDRRSDSATYFANDKKAYESAKTFHDGLKRLKKPLKLSEVIAGGLDQYKAVFFPGGHAPMTDLMASAEVGAILKHFHSKQKPTALICHGPVALAATAQDPAAFQKALAKGNAAQLKQLTQNWPYSGYKMTVFSTAEEKVAEADLGGAPQYYPEDVLKAGGGVVSVAKEWQPHAIRDRELITGQNPHSDAKFVTLLMTALKETK